MHLHITTPRLKRRADGTTALDLFSCFVESSHGNGENGASHGRFIVASSAVPMGPVAPPAATTVPNFAPPTVRPAAPTAPSASTAPASAWPPTALVLGAHVSVVPVSRGPAAPEAEVDTAEAEDDTAEAEVDMA